MIFHHGIWNEKKVVHYNPQVAKPEEFSNLEKQGYKLVAIKPRQSPLVFQRRIWQECPYAGGNEITILPSYPPREFLQFNPNGNLWLQKALGRMTSATATFTGKVGRQVYEAFHVASMCETIFRETRYTAVNCYSDINLFGITLNPAIYTTKAILASKSPPWIFVIKSDIAYLTNNERIPENEVVLWKKSPECVKANIVGLVAASAGEDYVLVSPIENKPPERAYYSGISTLTNVIDFLGTYSNATYTALAPDGNELRLVMSKLWVFRGHVEHGDSGAPVFI